MSDLDGNPEGMFSNDACGSIEPRHEKTGFCICEKEDTDQLRGNRESDQRLCFCYMASTIPLLLNTKFQASSHLL